jgi:hypothetical protein
MKRTCAYCQKDFTNKELARAESEGMEAERKALGLQGVLFRYFVCSGCGNAIIFVDIQPLEKESPEAFRRRRTELEETVNQVHGRGIKAVLVQR